MEKFHQPDLTSTRYLTPAMRPPAVAAGQRTGLKTETIDATKSPTSYLDGTAGSARNQEQAQGQRQCLVVDKCIQSTKAMLLLKCFQDLSVFFKIMFLKHDRCLHKICRQGFSHLIGLTPQSLYVVPDGPSMHEPA
jgi:hypothetical protein